MGAEKITHQGIVENGCKGVKLQKNRFSIQVGLVNKQVYT